MDKNIQPDPSRKLIIIFIIILFAGIGVMFYLQTLSRPLPPPPSPVVCTKDAIQCPDGSYVGRTGPHCEFKCPPGEPTPLLTPRPSPTPKPTPTPTPTPVPVPVPTPAFDFSLSNGGAKTVVQGQSVQNTVTATLVSGVTQPVSFVVSGLPQGASVNFSRISCSPTCGSTLTITTSATMAAGNYPITVRGISTITKITQFNLTVTALPPPVTSNVEVYPGPGTNTYLSNLYTVEVFDGTNWVPSYLYKFGRTTRIGNTAWAPNSYVSVNFTTFGTVGPVNVRVSKVGGSITSAQISPKSKNITANISGGKAIFTLNRNNKTWITINGDDENPLFIFADPFKPPVPAGATYFGPGIHTLAPGNNNHYQASNNEVIYLDGGAWVRGNIDVYGVTNVTVMGPGILSGDLWLSEDINPIHNIDFARFMTYAMITGGPANNRTNVSGITIVASPGFNLGGGVRSAIGVKLLSPWWWNTDGLKASRVDQSFAFVGDNVFYLASQAQNITITNSFVGTSLSAVFAGGYWGDPPSFNFPILVDNIDVKTLNSNLLTPVFQIWVGIDNSSYGFRNQTYQNIRIEGNIGVELIQLLNRIYPPSWPGPVPRYDPPLGNSYNLVFKNITLEGTQAGRSQIKGYDANNGFHDIILENVRINGTVVNPENLSNYFDVNSFVWGLGFGNNVFYNPPPVNE